MVANLFFDNFRTILFNWEGLIDHFQPLSILFCNDFLSIFEPFLQLGF